MSKLYDLFFPVCIYGVMYAFFFLSAVFFSTRAQETAPTPTYGAPENISPEDPSDIIQNDYEPDHPSCPGDGDVLLRFGTYHMIRGEPEIEEGYLFEIQIPEDFTARPGTVEVLQGEGHNWDDNCRTIQGPRDEWEELPDRCRNFQPEELVNIYWGEEQGSLQYIGGFDDNSPGAGNSPEDMDNITTAYTFHVPMIRPGTNYLHLIQPRPRFPIHNSVFIKGTFCAAPVIPEPDLSPTVTQPPVPTFVYSPDIPGPDQKADTDSHFHVERGADTDQSQNNSQDIDDNSDGLDNSEDGTDSSSDGDDADTEESSSDNTEDTDDHSMVYASTESLVDVGENPLPYTVVGIILLGVLFFF